jgi:RNA polymerase sigma-70 factor (ECF subfamily)
MYEMNIEVKKLAIGEGSQHIASVRDKMSDLPGSSARGYSYDNGILNHKESSDEELVRSFVKDQDEEAFSEIVNRYTDRVYRTALRITHNPSDAKDVLQEVFITLIEKLDSFHEYSKFPTWLYRVAANASYTHLRAKKKRYEKEVSLEDYASYNEYGALEGVQLKDWSDIPEEVLLSREGMEIIESAVNELPVAYRVVFLLRDVEELTNHEVAEIFGLSVPAVKSRIHRARLFLRDKLSDYFHEWRK